MSNSSNPILPTAALPRRGQAYAVILVLFLFQTLNFFDKVVFGLSAVPMMKELSLSPKTLGLIGSSFFLLFPIFRNSRRSLPDWTIQSTLGFGNPRSDLVHLADIGLLLEFGDGAGRVPHHARPRRGTRPPHSDARLLRLVS